MMDRWGELVVCAASSAPLALLLAWVALGRGWEIPGTALALAWALALSLRGDASSLADLLPALARGTAIAIAAALPLLALREAGSLADVLAGLRTAGPLRAVASILGAVLFFESGAHRLAVTALASAGAAPGWLGLAHLVSAAFAVAISIAAPLLLGLLVLDLGTAIAARASGIPIQEAAAPLRAGLALALGLLALAAALPYVASMYSGAIGPI